MNRRNCLKLVAVAAVVPSLKASTQPIQLHVDLDVLPARERELISNFRKTFEPAISKQPGFVGVKLLKLRSAIAGQMPTNMNYRLILSFQTEAQRHAWTATADHRRAWPSIETTLRANRGALLYDVI
jgi:antibiotic biosynthesis monooxygenase (ABM) superfamily enzyme